MNLSRPQQSPRASRLMVRLLDRTKRVDYVITAVFAAIPVCLSALMGMFRSRDDLSFEGYIESGNFWSLVLILPLLLWSIRWAMGRIAPVLSAWPPPEEPPILSLLETKAGKKVVYEKLRDWLLSPRIYVAALLVTVLVHIVDMSGFMIASYIHMDKSGIIDWRNFHLTGEIGMWPNLAFVLSAYAVQFAVVLMAFLGGFLLLVHNVFFLRRIYQRRWVPDGQEENFFEIDLADEDYCFGFREANNAFNTQIILLMAGGLMMLVSRFKNTPSWTELVNNPAGILPNAGQTMMVAGWLAALAVIALPSLVKLLPRLPVLGNPRASRRVTTYLREFISPQRWPFGRNPSAVEISALAARFASNSFWPTGNNRASQLFFFALWIGLVVLLPPPLDNAPWLIASLILTGVFAYLGKRLIFGLLNSSLRYVDDGLVDLPVGDLPELRLPGKKLDAGVFISYRRDDTAAYTGRLYDYLTDHFHRQQIFIDIESIEASDKWAEVLKEALANCAAVFVIIGPRWATIADAKGRPRLMNPDDWVRAEVATALGRDIPVFPILVGGARLPSTQDLPEDLAALCGRNAREISDTRWDYDARKLMGELRAAVDEYKRRTS